MIRADYAANPEQSLGRRYDEREPVYRTHFQRDRDRIIHSKAFRRLEYKTQVFVNHEGDLYRTRLTHSIEVAQIARAVARNMRLDEDLVEGIALAHDLGHTPFGHAGQDALNQCMKPFGGFEHNLQSLRVVDELEDVYADFDGLNLSFETREGVLKHCSLKHAADLGDVGERFIHKTQAGLEAQLANIADEIAYNNHDIDDGLRSGLITLAQLCEVPIFAQVYEETISQYSQLSGTRLTHEVLRRLINLMVIDLTDASTQAIETAKPQSIADVRQQAKPLMRYSDAMRQSKTQLKQFLRQNLYMHPKVYRMSWRASRIIEQLFDAYMNDRKLLPAEYQQALPSDQGSGEELHARRVSDYIAGMTDRYAMREYGDLFDLSKM